LSPVKNVPNEKSKRGFHYLQEKPYIQEMEKAIFEIFDQSVGITYEMQFNSSRALALVSREKVPDFISENEFNASIYDMSSLLSNLTEQFISIPIFKANDKGTWFMMVKMIKNAKKAMGIVESFLRSGGELETRVPPLLHGEHVPVLSEQLQWPRSLPEVL
jgi:hypothetical protein